MGILVAAVMSLKKGATVLQTQIRPSSLVLAILMGIGVVIGMITMRPSLTQMYYVQLGALIAGAGLIVTLYNYFLTAHMRQRSASPDGGGAAASALPAYAATQESVQPVSPVARPARAVVTEGPVPAEKSMNALLDMAYEAAEKNPLRAIAAYRHALASYPDDSYIPYLIIELSTLYKRMGAYNAALALFDEALTLPVVAKNADMAQEFQRSRKALAVVSHMLTAQGTPTLPFGEVPKRILAEADRCAEEPNI